MSVPEAEAELKRLSKLPENRRCANCEAEAQHGHGNVCVPFRSFVCGTCKSAHQAYSHRVKSATQSNWTLAEVEQLKARSGGGNDACRRSWLALCAPGDPARPRDGDHPDRYKAFVVAVYEQRRFYAAPQPQQQAAACLLYTSPSPRD
jgi:hypothetical protein